jgi:hypothetical protein
MAEKYFIMCTQPMIIGRKYITPKETLKKCFPDILFTFECIAWNPKSEGRMMYEIKLDTSYTTQQQDDFKARIIQALGGFGCCEKTPAEAKTLGEKVHSVEWELVGTERARPKNPLVPL